MKKLLIALALMSLAAATACDDDNPTAGDDIFRVSVTITDPSGAPVEGLQISAAPDLPEFYQDDAADSPGQIPEDGKLAIYPSPFYPVARMEFNSVMDGHMTLTVEDVKGRTVEVLVDDERLAGQFQFDWDGLQTPSGPLPGGVYFARLVLWSGTEVRLEETEPMLYVPLYPDQYSIGVTDSRGELVILEAAHFPQLFELPPIPARDETGTVVANITLGPRMRFYARDPESGQMMRFDRDVDGSCKIEATWDPEI